MTDARRTSLFVFVSLSSSSSRWQTLGSFSSTTQPSCFACRSASSRASLSAASLSASSLTFLAYSSSASFLASSSSVMSSISLCDSCKSSSEAAHLTLRHSAIDCFSDIAAFRRGELPTLSAASNTCSRAFLQEVKLKATSKTQNCTFKVPPLWSKKAFP